MYFTISFPFRFSVSLCRYTKDVDRSLIDDNFKSTFILKIVTQTRNEPQLAFIRRRSGDKHRTFVLVVFETILNSTDPWLENLLSKYFIEYNIFNMVTIFLLNDNEHPLNMYTYSPYEERIVRFNNSIYQQEQLFYDKTLNFYGKPFRVSLFPEEVRAVLKEPNNTTIYGLDAFLAELLTKKLNSTLILLGSPDQEEYGNPTAPNNASGTLGQVVREEVEISLNSRFLRLDLFFNNNIAEPTVPIGRDDMCILVPKSGYTPTITNFFNSLTPLVWALALTVIIPFTVIFRTIASYEHKHLHRTPYCPSYLDMLRFYFNQNLPKLPETLTLRFIIIPWIFYSFLIVNIFQSCMTTTFTVKHLEKEINTIDGLSQSNYRIIASIDYARLIKRYFNGSMGTDRKQLTDKLWPMEWYEYNQFIGNNNLNYAYANKNHMTNYYANIKLSGDVPLYHSMRECPVQFLACYIVPYGSPLLGRINDILNRLNNAGIFRYWEQMMKAGDARVQLARSQGAPEPLSFNKMFAFYFLVTGWSIGIAVFLGEYFFAPQIIKLKTVLKNRVGLNSCRLNQF